MSENSDTMRKEVEVTIEFPNLTREKMKHIFNAEEELRKAGIDFDTGFYFPKHTRDWEFDWSLKGAKVYLHKTDDKKEK